MAAIASKVLLHLLSWHHCQIVIHLQSENRTQQDNVFMSQVIPELNVALMMLQTKTTEDTFTSSLDIKTCITSFSEAAIEQYQFDLNSKHKRPVKILLNKMYSRGFPKPNYRPIVVEYAPVISLITASFSTSKYNTS